ncbi:uncharacterized protein LOC142537626 [Primulina tabacum]|uniref:uncharacterized protein LOC142537626 n=1 Tax=Primulina tabacum TaxID=48773 RepID=UPI003F5994AC
MDFSGGWQESLSLVEFSYNNSFQATIGMVPFEALYDRKCRSPICWEDVGERQMSIPEFIQEMKEKVEMIRKRMKAAQDRQSLSAIHDVFHVSMMRKYEPDPSHVLRTDEVELDSSLSYVEHPLQILERKEKQLRNKTTPLVMVQWSRHGREEAK